MPRRFLRPLPALLFPRFAVFLSFSRCQQMTLSQAKASPGRTSTRKLQAKGVASDRSIACPKRPCPLLMHLAAVPLLVTWSPQQKTLKIAVLGSQSQARTQNVLRWVARDGPEISPSKSGQGFVRTSRRSANPIFASFSTSILACTFYIRSMPHNH